MLENFLSKLGASTRITIGVAVSPGIGLEMIEVDRVTGTVTKYATKLVEYNTSTREISNYEQFRVALEELFEELHIPRKSNVILTLPNVHFGLMTLPLLLTDEAITNAIISEVEQSYIFKRQEPIVSWAEVYSNENTENRTLVYTAIQKEALDQIKEICEEIGCTLSGLETSYSSLFRALHYTGAAKEQMQENVSWNLMLIVQNNYSIISMSGKKIVEYYEEPLALKSFIDDEIYNAIKSSAQLTLAGLPANYLYIVSETDLVSAEVMSIKMSFEGYVSFLECNKFIQNELVPVSLNILPKLAMQITPEAIGIGVSSFSDFPLKLNLIQNQDTEGGLLNSTQECPRVNIGSVEVELTPDFIKKVALIAGAVIIIPVIALFLALNNLITPKEQAKLDGLTTKVTSLNADIKKYTDSSKEDTFDLKTTVDNIVTQNENKLTYYSALGVNTPGKLWIDYFQINEAGNIDIKGETSDVSKVYTFYKSLKQTVNNSSIRLYKLELASGSIDDIIVDNPTSAKLYQFEITNMTEQELNPAAAPPTATTPTQPGTPQDATKPAPLSFGSFFAPKQGNNSPNQPGTPTPAPSTQIGHDQLPQNLKKIEKF